MRIRNAVLLGAVQGITELLPVSSSAHLTLVRSVVGQTETPRAFDIALHLATAAALAPTAGRTLTRALAALAADAPRHQLAWRRYRSDAQFAVNVGLATLPAVLVGGIGHRAIESWSRSPRRVAAGLLAGSALMAAAEMQAARPRDGTIPVLTPSMALLIGLAQAAALLPGVSRCGATVATAMLAGVDREQAVEWSFVLAAPVTAAAAAHVLPELRAFHRSGEAPALAVGLATALATGAIGMLLLRRLLARGGLLPFAVYRIVLAAAIRRQQPR